MLLSDFAPELLVQVFVSVDITSLLRCRHVCRAFRDAITSEPSLQYRIVLFSAGMINHTSARPDLPIVRRHQQLKEYIKQQETIPKEWMMKATLIDTSKGQLAPTQWVYHAGFWASLRGGTEYKETKEKARAYEEREYVVGHIQAHEARRHFVDANQDLLILAEGVDSASLLLTAHLHLLSLKTGKSHPLAAIPTLSLGQDWSFSVRAYNVVVYEDLIAIWISFNDTMMVTSEITTQIEVWNWKVGERTLLLNDGGDLCATFLSTTHLLVFSVIEATQELSLRIHLIPSFTSYSEPEPSELLRIPLPPMKRLVVEGLQCSFSDGYTNLLTEPTTMGWAFGANPVHSIIILDMGYSVQWRYLLVFQRSALLTLLPSPSSASPSRKHIEWKEFAKISSLIPVTVGARVYAYGGRMLLGDFSEKKVQIVDWKGWFKTKGSTKNQGKAQPLTTAGGSAKPTLGSKPSGSTSSSSNIHTLLARPSSSRYKFHPPWLSASATPHSYSTSLNSSASSSKSSVPKSQSSTSTSPSSSSHSFLIPIPTTDPPAPIQEIYTGEEKISAVVLGEGLVGVLGKAMLMSTTAERMKVYQMNLGI